MKKGFWVGFSTIFVTSLLIGLLIKYWDSSDIDKIISLFGVVVSAAAIVFVVRNTNRQIENQNKERHRPYLVAKRINSIDVSVNPKIIYSAYIAEKNNKNKKVLHLKTFINLSNLGYGIATNLKMYSGNEKYSISRGNLARRNAITDYNEVSIREGADCFIEFNIDMTRDTYPLGDRVPIILFYSDLNQNVYSLLIDIIKLEDNYIVGYCNHSGTKQFHMLFEDMNAYNQRKDKYIKEVYGYEE